MSVIYVCCFASVVRKQVNYHPATQFMVRTEEVDLFCNISLEADNTVRSKIIRGFQNFEIGSRELGHANLGVVYGPYAHGDGIPPLYQF